MNFVAFDVETANADLSSVCQIGIVRFIEGQIAQNWTCLINPEVYFDPINVRIHGIRPEDVGESPTFPQIAKELHEFFEGQVVVHHTPFDRSSVHAVHSRYQIPLPQINWLDSAKVVRRTWGEFSRSGFGLNSVAKKLGIEFRHHDAGEDARVAGEIVLRAMSTTEATLDQWLDRVCQPITHSDQRSRVRDRGKRDGNPEGPLAGEVVVFTGAISVPRTKASELAAASGCEVGSSVTKATTLLVVGNQDVSRLEGHEKSSKHRRAEQLILDGQSIRILRESDFFEMIQTIERSGGGEPH